MANSVILFINMWLNKIAIVYKNLLLTCQYHSTQQRTAEEQHRHLFLYNASCCVLGKVNKILIWLLLCRTTVIQCLLTDSLYCIVLCVTWRPLICHVTVIGQDYCDKVPSDIQFVLHFVVCYVKTAKLSCDCYWVGLLWHSAFWQTVCTALCCVLCEDR